MKIKRTTQGNAPSSAVQGRARSGGGADKTAAVERKDVTDTVTLSGDALAVGAVSSVNQVEAADADPNGPLPDPRETGRAILERELASVFKEIYL